MSTPAPLDARRHDEIATEARRLAGSGKYATLLEVEQALVEHGISAAEVHAVFDRDPPLRAEVHRLAEKGHGVGGGATV